MSRIPFWWRPLSGWNHGPIARQRICKMRERGKADGREGACRGMDSPEGIIRRALHHCPARVCGKDWEKCIDEPKWKTAAFDRSV